MEIQLFIFLAVLALAGVESKFIVYNTSAGIDPVKLNVHLVPHTHDDVGWLKTVDQYYVGSNNSIQGACVQNVLDSLVPALLADKNRKFIYVEQAFFQRWWDDQSDTVKSIVKQLINSGQLELINGGMVMHDEAAPHYIDMIDQTTLGHRFIKEEFGVTPRIGWQIDPFGHSAVQAYLLGAEVGFDSFFFGRIDYQDRAKRKDEKRLEVVWRASKSLGSSAQIFAGAFPENYEPPPGFYFEVNDDSDSPVVQDNPNLFDFNVHERVNDFVAAALAQANITRTNHIMWTMGTDFKYQYAHTWFRNMDKLIHYVNKDGRVNALYSTPSIYTDAKFATKSAWPLKTGDFFPYADRPNGYWTGYFTSRPSLKRYVRLLSGYYLAARQLEFFKGKSTSGPNTNSLADALAIAQHHDAVSGTAKQHVTNDYVKRLAIGYAEAEAVVASSLANMVGSASHKDGGSATMKFEQCPLLNISYCPPSETIPSHGKNLMVVVYNSLGWEREDIIQVPVITEDVSVHDADGNEVESQFIPISHAHQKLRAFHVKSYLGKSSGSAPKYWLLFKASVPALGFTTYSISNANSKGAYTFKISTFSGHNNNKKSSFSIAQGNLELKFSRGGKLSHYSDTRNSVDGDVDISYSYYGGSNGTKEDPQKSGAYIFRPNGTFPLYPEGRHARVTVVRGNLVDEVHQKINSWIYQVTRLNKAKDHVEVEFIVGPIPIDDGMGKEIATQISTSMLTNKTFYTDSSGRDFIERIRDYRSDWDLQVNQPAAGNYYPINLGIYMKDDKKEFSVLVDRSVGGSSLSDGQIELMLHRRLVVDDSRGVDEALNETVCAGDKCTGLIVQGKYYFRYDKLGEGSKWRRTYGQEIYSPLLLAFAEQDGDDLKNSRITTFSGIDSSYTLPKNVAILTLEELSFGKVLLRLAHLYEVGEDKDLSVMTTVELKKLFPRNKIAKVTETSLSANQERAEMERKRLVWEVEGGSEEGNVSKRGKVVDPSKLEVELSPMEIRTFIVELGQVEGEGFDA